jgi:hypothetical protein
MRGGWTKWILLLVAVVVLAMLALKTRDKAAEPLSQRAAEPAREVRKRTIAFDNLYGDATEVHTFIKVDDTPEQMLTARCTPSTCTFEFPLTDGKHELVIAVEQNAHRSESTRVTLDTSGVR